MALLRVKIMVVLIGGETHPAKFYLSQNSSQFFIIAQTSQFKKIICSLSLSLKPTADNYINNFLRGTEDNLSNGQLQSSDGEFGTDY